MMVSMISPMLFWPSLVPCAKLTPLQVSMRTPRIHQIGGLSVTGSYKCASCRVFRHRKYKAPASTNPSSGDTASASKTFQSCAQCTSSPRLRKCSNESASAIPMSEPMRQCELELGRANHQVAMFQLKAAMNKDTNIEIAGPPSG